MHFAIYSMLFLEDRPRIGTERANSQSTMEIVIRHMHVTGPIWKKIRACSTQFTYSITRRDDGSSILCNIWCRIWCQWAFEVQFPEILIRGNSLKFNFQNSGLCIDSSIFQESPGQQLWLPSFFWGHARNIQPARHLHQAWIAEHWSGKVGAGAAAVIPAAGITSVISD